MVISKIAVCPICGKKTCLRIEDGGYLNDYPIRVNCANCKTLIIGSYIMTPYFGMKGLHLINADVEECETDTRSDSYIIKNADYIMEVSGELLCRKMTTNNGSPIKDTPYINASNYFNVVKWKSRVSEFNTNLLEWKKDKRIAFQLLEDGGIDYVSVALNNQMGEYAYKCDHYLKSLHCLQEIVLEETRYLFTNPKQDNVVDSIRKHLSLVNKDELDLLVDEIGGIQSLVNSFRKITGVFSDFMEIYPNVLPAESFLQYSNKDTSSFSISTCTFADLKSFYQDSYETVMALLYLIICIDNITERGHYLCFDSGFARELTKRKYADIDGEIKKFLSIDNGNKIRNIKKTDYLQSIINVPDNSYLRNGIGHNNFKYDGITQTIDAYDLRDPSITKRSCNLLDMALECIELVKSSVKISEIILFLLRHEFRKNDIKTIVHPRFYKDVSVNDRCPCGSGLKYKRCCKRLVDATLLGSRNNIN